MPASHCRTMIIASAITVLAALGGCTELRTGHVSRNFDTHTGDGAPLARALASGTVPTMIIGNPFGVDRPDFKRTVSGYLKGGPKPLDANFVPIPTSNDVDDVRIVIAFDLAEETSPNQLCADPESLKPTHNNSAIFFNMAVCELDLARDAVHGAVDDVWTPYDKEFTYFIGEAMKYLTGERHYIGHHHCLKVDCS